MMRALERRDPGALLSFLLAITMHVALFTVLVFGIQWRTKRPDPVMAELWTQLPAVEPPRLEPPKPEPKPEPRPEPKVEPKPPPKPDIALEQERKRKEEEARKLREEAERKKQEELRAKEERERRERELAEKRQFEQETRERMQEQLNRELATAKTPGPPLLGDPRARARWGDRIKARIHPNIVVPPDMPGNPEAIFDVELLPTGEVLSAKLRKSSGVKAWDDAVERAILKSSPLPLPEQREVFERRLVLTFRPKD